MAIRETTNEVELIAERDMLKRIVSSLGEGVRIVGPDYKVHFQNEFLLHRFGDLEDILCYEGYMGRSEPCESCPILKAIESNSTQSAEVVAADGKLYKIVASPFIDTDGETRSVELVRDITGHKQAEENIISYAKRQAALHTIAATVSQTLDLQQMLDNAVEKVIEVMDVDIAAISIIDEATRESTMIAHRGLSEEFIASIGRMKLEPDELERTLSFEGQIAPPQETVLNQPNLERLMAAAIKEGLVSNIIVRILARGFFFGSMSVSCRNPREFTKDDEELLCAIANQIAVGMENAKLHEQTQMRAEELKASEAKYRRLVEDINEGYMVVNLDGTIAFANARMAQIAGYTLKQLIGKNAAEYITTESLPYAQELKRRAEQGQRLPEHLEGSFLRKDGREVPVEASVKVIDYGSEPALAVIVRDITERKKAESEILRHARHEEALHYIADTINRTLDLREMLNGVLKKVLDVTETDAGSIYLVDEAAGEIDLLAYIGLSGDFVAETSRQKLEPREFERVMAWRETLTAMGEKPISLLSMVYDETRASRIAAAMASHKLQSRVIIPISSRGKVLGLLASGCYRRREFTSEETGLLENIANHLAVGIENARLFAEVTHSATVDWLTGLYNHRYFQERLEEEVARVLRHGGECSLIMLDLDHFKIYNDLFGHVAGDEVLKRVGQILRDHTRQVDIACRYGGEEFTIILPQTGSADAHTAAERLRQAVEAALSPQGGTERTPVTISLGVASFPGDGLSREALVHSTDLAMREAKQRGRNQTCIASELDGAATADGVVGWKVAEHLEAASLNTIYALAAAVDARDHYTYAHSRNVAKYAVTIGRALGLSRRKLERLRIAALLHDIGKIGLSDSIIRKPGPLDEEEWEIMRKHSNLGATIISHSPELADCAPAIRHHHEWYDGNGYPDSLKGESIPLEARIIAIADAYDTMTTPRAYRQMASSQEALEELRRCASTQFDPKVVETFAQSTG